MNIKYTKRTSNFQYSFFEIAKSDLKVVEKFQRMKKAF